ncbi:ArsR/SmtB family transcription factor [Luteimonas aquatica]|uniref:ArsR/SmtB family transcription factor n=1 Tax=Luteimonas aquatica TaxID=450364 RepID=UPI001F5AA5CB|nr:metalloregulator ArsR/SmtB family transcription factor [Luteimonas aquatica]
MDEYQPSRPAADAVLDEVFAALSDRTRREMLARLSRGQCSVGELAAPFSMSLAAASKHIRVLEDAGLVRREVLGRTHRVRLHAQPLHAGMEWIRHYERFWHGRLDALEALLRAEDAAAPTRASKPRSPDPAKKKKRR